MTLCRDRTFDASVPEEMRTILLALDTVHLALPVDALGPRLHPDSLTVQRAAERFEVYRMFVHPQSIHRAALSRKGFQGIPYSATCS